MRVLRLVLAFLGLGLVGVGLAEPTSAQKPTIAKRIVQQPLAALEWAPVAPGAPILGAAGWQGPGGSYCGFAKFPKGFSEPPHFHSNDLYVLVLEGQWGVWAPGAPEQYVGAGGYQFIPGGVKHLSRCGPTSACVVYDCGPAPFDIQGLPPAK
jgi:uncharacterized protein DUF4437